MYIDMKRDKVVDEMRALRTQIFPSFLSNIYQTHSKCPVLLLTLGYWVKNKVTVQNSYC